VIVPFRYEEPVVSALRAIKFHDAPYLAGTLSFFMAEAIRMESGEFDAVIPIPLSSERLKKRGYNQAALLAEPLARARNLPSREFPDPDEEYFASEPSGNRTPMRKYTYAF
jgi:predicted amidophosphoribosyltransferase